jgi:hypothetical protein
VPDGKRCRFEYSGFETAHLTVGHKMETGIYLALEDGSGGGGLYGEYGGHILPSVVPSFGSIATNEAFAELRITIFETDQPPGYHVDPKQGKYYRVLWSRTFTAPFPHRAANKQRGL